MGNVIIPALKPIPPGATKEDRQKMYAAHCDELQRLNPSSFNPDGSVKTFWQSIKGFFMWGTNG